VGERIDPVDHTERSLLVRNGQVAAGEAERRERPQRGALAVCLDGKRQVAADQPVLRQPLIVQLRRAGMHHREAHQAGQQEAVRMRHDSFVAIGPDRQQVHAQLSIYCKL
jgi:hypothetical protein